MRIVANCQYYFIPLLGEVFHKFPYSSPLVKDPGPTGPTYRSAECCRSPNPRA